MQNNGIFKDVEHYHMHIIPRFKNDGFSWIEPDIKVSKRDIHSLSESIKNALENNY